MKLVADGARILFSRVGQVLANAVVVMLVAKTLGPVGQGHFSLTMALALLMGSLLGGGMGLAAVPPLRRGVVSAVRMVRAQTLWAVAMSLLLFLLALWSMQSPQAGVFARRLGWSPPLGVLAAIAAFSILGFEICSYDLMARGRVIVSASVNGVRAVGQLVLVFGLFLAGALTLERAVGAFALTQAVGMLALAAILWRDLGRSVAPMGGSEVGAVVPEGPAPVVVDDDLPEDLPDRSLLGLVLFNLRRGWLGQLSAVAYFLLLRLDQGMLEYYRGVAEVGIYSIAVYVGEMLWLLPGALTPLLVHSSAAHAGDPQRDRNAARALRWGILVTLVAAVPLYLLADPLVSLLAGPEFQGAAPALRALLPGIVAFAPGAVLAGDFIGRGKPHWNTQASVLTVVVNVAVGVVLIPRHGPIGAAWSSTIAYALGSAVMLARFRQATRLSLLALLMGRG
jgi:O-antigen/teichoic acid export membrane protein